VRRAPVHNFYAALKRGSFYFFSAPVQFFNSPGVSEKRPLRRRAKRRRKRASLEVRRLPSVGVALRISSVFPTAATANLERAMSHGRCALSHLLGTSNHQSGESAAGSAKLGRLRQCEEGLKAIEAAVDVESVVAAMRGREESAEVQKAACLHIGRLAEGNMTRAGTAGAVEAVAAAVRAHAGSAGLQEAACQALVQLTGTDERNRTRAGTAAPSRPWRWRCARTRGAPTYRRCCVSH
jgi:hypothetical protein